MLKWYWFHLAVQVGFAAREFLVISSLRGWRYEVTLAHVASWITILLASREVWEFSKVRCGSVKQKVAVDGLLDMLLLPVNISFFCGVCVRVLKLQPASHMRTMVAVVIESPDIYEAFALWSVLELFVKVVDAETANRDEDTMSSFTSFKSISLQGVKAWVIITFAAVAFKLVLQGVIAVYVPTLCFSAAKSCISCSEWYDEKVATALSAVTFILCSFAIMFVFYFEAGYRHLLRKIEPMWKFLGVKGIVSVTYFQWVVISVLAGPLGWDDTQVYLLHCLLYAFWMPLLTLLHMFLAYPFWTRRNPDEPLAPWLVAWLGTLHTNEQADAVGHSGIADASTGIGIEGYGLGSSADTQAGPAPAWLPKPQPLSRWRVFFYLSFCTLCCFASVEAILRVIPVDDRTSEEPLRNITCTDQGDLAHFLQTRNDLHFALLNDTVEKWTMPGVAGSWLPLCASTPVACQMGHYFQQAAPSVSCTALGQYTWVGTCDAISCGMPPRLPHASPRMHDMEQQNWTYGVTIHYDCAKPGFRGDLKAICNITGVWTVHGGCVEVTCGPPPQDIPNAKPLVSPGREGQNVSTGMVVRYQCDQMYNGTPTATCGDDGMYITAGRCRRECGPPPTVPHASPSFDNVLVANGWFEGMRCPYVCDPGFKGFATALCGDGGNYSVTGLCNPVSCGAPPQLPHATPRMDDVAPQHFTYGETVRYDCDRPRFAGSLAATCNISGHWIVHGRCVEITCGPPPQDVPHAKLVIEPGHQGNNVSIGTVVRYQCDQTYNGTPTATCGVDAMYVEEGRCRKECGPPPRVPHASPSFDNEMVAAGWIEGMGAKYACDPGFEGSATALCGTDGNYTVDGQCSVASSVKTDRLYKSIHGLTAAIATENSLLLAAVGFLCWRFRCATARLRPLLARVANQELGGGPASQYGLRDSPGAEQLNPSQQVQSS